jgi:hypothetical protein
MLCPLKWLKEMKNDAKSRVKLSASQKAKEAEAAMRMAIAQLKESELALRVAIDNLIQKKKYSHLKPDQLKEKIQKVWEIPVGHTGRTVKIFLWNRNRAKAFNCISPVPDFEQTIKDFLTARLNHSPSAKERRSINRVVKAAWPINQARDRRALAGNRSPNRGKREIYPPEIVITVHDHLAGCLDLKKLPFARKSPDANAENTRKPYGPTLELWIATLYYLVCVIEASSGSRKSPIRKPSPEALISTLNRRASFEPKAFE